jgi:hypothetical protein
VPLPKKTLQQKKDAPDIDASVIHLPKPGLPALDHGVA